MAGGRRNQQRSIKPSYSKAYEIHSKMLACCEGRVVERAPGPTMFDMTTMLCNQGCRQTPSKKGPNSSDSTIGTSSCTRLPQQVEVNKSINEEKRPGLSHLHHSGTNPTHHRALGRPPHAPPFVSTLCEFDTLRASLFISPHPRPFSHQREPLERSRCSSRLPPVLLREVDMDPETHVRKPTTLDPPNLSKIGLEPCALIGVKRRMGFIPPQGLTRRRTSEPLGWAAAVSARPPPRSPSPPPV